MKKFIIVLFAFLLFSIPLQGCSKKKTVIDSLNGKVFEDGNVEYVIKKDEIKELEILSEESLDNSNQIKVNIILNKDEVEISGELDLIYNKNDILESIKVDENSKILYKPIKGISKSSIQESLYGQTITIKENDKWQINEDEIQSIKIIDQKTKLDENIDNVTFEITLKSITSKTKGKLNVVYNFEESEWTLQTLDTKDEKDFKYEFIDEFKPSETSNELDKDIAGQKIYIPYNKNYTIKKGDFKVGKISKKTISTKGKSIDYVFDYKFKKEAVTIEGEMNLNCYFKEGEGWLISEMKPINKTEKINFAFEGIWKGTCYKNGNKLRDFTIEIKNPDNKGKLDIVMSHDIGTYRMDVNKYDIETGGIRFNNYGTITGKINANYSYAFDGIINLSENTYKGDIYIFLIDHEGTFEAKKQ